MLVEIKNFKPFHGHDGQGYSYSLYLDGKRSAIISNDGWGGEEMVDTYKGDSTKFDEFCKLCSELPARQSRYGDGNFPITWDYWILDLVELADQKRNARGKTIIRKEDGNYYILSFADKRKYTQKNHAMIMVLMKEKYPTAFLVNGCKVEATL